MSLGYVRKELAEHRVKPARKGLHQPATLAYLSVCEMDKVSIYAIRDNHLEEIIVGMLGKDAYVSSIGKLNDIEFSGDSRMSDAIVPSSVGYGDGMSIIISDFLTDNDYERAIDHLASKKRHVLCIQVLSKEEIAPRARGKMHFFDSEELARTYRKNITRDIIKAYRQAVDYATGRIRNFCAVRGADYMLVQSEENIGEVFFKRLVNEGVLK